MLNQHTVCWSFKATDYTAQQTIVCINSEQKTSHKNNKLILVMKKDQKSTKEKLSLNQ